MRFTFLQDFLSLVFPDICCVCRRSLFDFEDHLCKICISKLPVTSYHLVPDENELKTKVLGLTEVNRVMAYLRFAKHGMSQKILHQIKYRNKSGLGRSMGVLYGNLLMQNGFSEAWDMIVPIPLHKVKLRRRGYNQSEMFAEGISQAMRIPVRRLITRKTFTETQTKKSRLQRWENVSGVFSLEIDINTEDCKGSRVLLVDDVMTTGATLAAAANVLHMFSPQSVDLAVIAAGK